LDRRLGLIYFALMGAIFAYIIIYSVFVKQGYIATEVPTGSVRSTLLPPTQFQTVDKLKYCNSTVGDTVIPCYYGDQYDLVFPVSEVDAMFISTRITKTYFKALNECVTDQLSYSCRQRSDILYNTTYYFASVEDFTISIEHLVRGDQVNVTKLNTDIDGQLLDSNENVLKSFTDDARPSDIISVSDLLQAAGISLSDLSQSKGPEKGEPLRNAGVVLIIFVTYSNSLTNVAKISYTYRVAYIPGADYQADEPRWLQNADMILYSRHGIRMVFIQTGLIGQFDFLTLLTTIVSGLVLTSLATLFVDVIALRVLPERSMYKHYKREVTIDFAEFRDHKIESPFAKKKKTPSEPKRDSAPIEMENHTAEQPGK